MTRQLDVGRRKLPAILAMAGLCTTSLITVSSAVAAPGAPAAPAAVPVKARATPVATTSAVERRRVDSVPTPKLRWYPCYEYAECATVRLPLDYDQPKGATTEVAVLRVKARDQRRKIGTLFVNPGGPGGSATQLAYVAPLFLSNSVLSRFDIVGVDPRGIGFGDNVRCFRSTSERNIALAPLDQTLFPYGRAQEAAYVKAAKALGRACSTTGRPLTGAMSTSEVARDMDVMRRAVGDKKLTYLGFSYGSVLGQYYANLFPDRVRALAIDGVINPVNWVGSPATRESIQDDRLRSADGAYKALREILVRCDRAGGASCKFAGGDPVANFDLIARRLRAKPLVLPDGGGITYPTFVGATLGALYSPEGYRNITEFAQQLLIATEPPSPRTDAKVQAATKRAAALLAAMRKGAQGRDFPYDNSLDALSAVNCTDGYHPTDASLWPAKVVAADKRAPYFGRAWAYLSIPCARSTWTVRDEDAYQGPWTKRTSGPTLVVGNYWDPATNYVEAVAVSKLLPNSGLLSSNSWGHTAYGTSTCATGTVDRFLLTQALPKKGTVCVGDIQPFKPGSRTARATGKVLPPVPNPWFTR